MPLLLFVLYTSLFLIWHLFNFPSTEVLTVMVNEWFNKYGIPVLLLGSFLEGVLLVGSYFPGVFIIFLGVVVADSALEATLAVFISTIGLLIAHILNYFLGKYGWYRLLVKFGMSDAVEQSKRRLEKQGPKAILFSYWLPSLGTITDTAAGIIGIPFKIFIKYSVISSIFWYSLVGALVFISGDVTLSVATGGTGMIFVYTFIFVWMIILISVDYFERKKISNN